MDWAKKVYVDVAFEEFAEPGKKMSVSRVSALTGLFRREVKRLHELDPDTDSVAGDRYNRAIKVISGWLNDARFQDGAGQPAELDYDGGDASFAELARAYSGDVTARAMYQVLEAAGSVEQLDDGRVRLVRHAFIPSGDATGMLNILGTDVAELVGTIDHNLTCDKPQRLFQRKVSNHNLDPGAVAEFRELSRHKSQHLLEELDTWLSEHELDRAGDRQDGTYVSVGIYYADANENTECKS